MEWLVSKIRQDHPKLVFSSGHSHCWSPEQGEISYSGKEEPYGIESLLHELGHARLAHHSYRSDLELLQKEVDAWAEATQMAQVYQVALDQDHIQDCLDTYRDWVHKRSACPRCNNTGLQDDKGAYICVNCEYSWDVTSSRFCRPYRRSKVKDRA